MKYESAVQSAGKLTQCLSFQVLLLTSYSRSQEPLAYHEELQRQPLKPPVPAALPQQQMPATLGTPAISHRLPDADDHECEDHDGLDSGSDERLLEAVSSRNRKLSFSAKSAATRRSPRSKVASDQDSQSLVKPMSLVPSQRRKSASLLNKETGKTAREILTTRNGPEFEHVPVEEWSDRSDILAAPRSSLAAGQSLSGGTLMELIQSFNPDHEHNLVLDPVTIDTTCQAFRPRCHIWPTIGRIVIPIDDPQRSHWALGIGNLRARCIQIFDSIPDDQRFQTYAQTVQSFIERHYEHRDGVAQWSHEQLALSSRQRNGFDCGLYVTIVAACQMNGLECPPSITSNLWRRCFLRIFGKCNDFRSPMADFMLPSRPSPTGRRFDLEIAIANEERIKADMESIRQLRTETALAARILAAGEDGFKKIVGQKIMLQSTLKWADEMPNHYPMQQLIDPVVDRVQELKRHAKSQILLVNALEARIEGMYAACELCRTDLVELDRLLIEQRNQHLRVSRSVDVLMEGYAERHRTAQVNEDS